MNSTIYFTRIQKTLLVDAVILAFVYFIPTISHLVAYPLYYFEPMRVALFASILFLSDKKNAYFLAITLPLFSFVISGHPIAVKNMIMAIELVTNVFFLNLLSKKHNHFFEACFLSIVLSKSIYYILKYVAISTGLLSIDLLGTPIIYQMIVVMLLSLAYLMVNIKTTKGNGE